MKEEIKNIILEYCEGISHLEFNADKLDEIAERIEGLSQGYTCSCQKSTGGYCPVCLHGKEGCTCTFIIPSVGCAIPPSSSPLKEGWTKSNVKNNTQTRRLAPPPKKPPLKIESYIFDQELIQKSMATEKPYYVIGVDALDEKALTYCLTRKIGDKIDFLASKTMKDNKEFRQEIETLVKIFKADVYETDY